MELPDLLPECIFKAVRSGGKGGQNVNKVSSKVELYFHIGNSRILTEDQKRILQHKLSHLLNTEGDLRIVCDSDRSQLRNKAEAYSKLEALFIKALTPIIPRKKTKIPRAVKQTRLATKKKVSEKKQLRRKPGAGE